MINSTTRIEIYLKEISSPPRPTKKGKPLSKGEAELCAGELEKGQKMPGTSVARRVLPQEAIKELQSKSLQHHLQ